METEIGTAADLTYRLIGSIGGSAIAIAIVQPYTLSGLLKRLAVSLTSGMMFAPVAIAYLEWPVTRDNIIASSCVAAAIAWGVWHCLIRAAQTWPPAMPRRKE